MGLHDGLAAIDFNHRQQCRAAHRAHLQARPIGLQGALGALGRRFESCRPDLTMKNSTRALLEAPALFSWPQDIAGQ